MMLLMLVLYGGAAGDDGSGNVVVGRADDDVTTFFEDKGLRARRDARAQKERPSCRGIYCTMFLCTKSTIKFQHSVLQSNLVHIFPPFHARELFEKSGGVGAGGEQHRNWEMEVMVAISKIPKFQH